MNSWLGSSALFAAPTSPRSCGHWKLDSHAGASASPRAGRRLAGPMPGAPGAGRLPGGHQAMTSVIRRAASSPFPESQCNGDFVGYLSVGAIAQTCSWRGCYLMHQALNPSRTP